MNTVEDELPIVREVVWLYAGETPIRVRVLSSPETWGSGDNEDDEVTAESQPIPCFFLAYESAGSPGRFSNIAANLMSLEAATDSAEKRFPGIAWVSGVGVNAKQS
jgi:hypothetical protein